MIKAVIDTNLFISAVMSAHGSPHRVLRALQDRTFLLVLSGQQLAELREVFTRPRLIARFTLPQEQVDALFVLFETDAEIVHLVGSLPLHVRDPKDDRILATAIDGHADYLVTGDNDLLVLAGDQRLGSLRIVTAAEFLAALPE